MSGLVVVVAPTGPVRIDTLDQAACLVMGHFGAVPQRSEDLADLSGLIVADLPCGTDPVRDGHDLAIFVIVDTDVGASSVG